MLAWNVISCSNKKTQFETMQNQLYSILQKDDIGNETRYAVINKIASNMLSVNDYNSLVIFLTEWV